jgi:hypothetical protein
MPKTKRYGFKPLVVDWNGLKAMGWPFSRVETVERNNGRYPKFTKLGPHRNARLVWRTQDVLAYFERHGLEVTQDWYAPDEKERTIESLEAAE